MQKKRIYFVTSVPSVVKKYFGSGFSRPGGLIH
jgi:hypothetical protein